MTPRILLPAAIAVVCLIAFACGLHMTAGLGLLALGMTVMAPGVRTPDLQETKALPNGAASIYTDGIDLGGSTRAQFAGGTHVELLIEAPALATADLGDGATMTYEVQHDTDSAFGTAVSLYGGPNLTQTGAGGAGAAAATKRVALPTDVKRYVRLKATNSAAGDASDKDVTLSLVF